MRIAALYDVHGNLPALEAVLAEVDAASPDLVLVGGDFLLGPFPRESLERLLALGERAVFIRGNTEREVLAGETQHGGVWAERVRWAAERLTEADHALLARLPASVGLEVAGLGPTLFCHGSPRRDDEIVTRATPEARIREIVAAVSEDIVVCGHTHVQFDRRVAGKRVVNAGSVGMPYEDDPGTRWALLGPGVELRRTPYDLEAAAERIAATAFPAAGDFAREYVLSPPSAAEATEAFEQAVASDGGG